jgi:serine/threonine protein phosphatase PrpC
MRKVFSLYGPDQDSFIEEHIDISSFHIESATVSGRKYPSDTGRKNEDAYTLVFEGDRLLCGVFDGVSSQMPIEGLIDTTGARFASHTLRQLTQIVPKYVLNNSVKKISADCSNHEIPVLSYLNRHLREQSSQITGFNYGDIHTMPASTATIAVIDIPFGMMHIEHIGDSWCIIFFNDGTSRLVTVDLNKRFDEETFVLMQHIAQESNISNRDAVKDERVKEKIKNKFSLYHNKSDGAGTGVLNGHEDALMYIQSMSVSLEGVSMVLFGTDGLVPPDIDESTPEGRTEIKMCIQSGGLSALIARKKQSEDADIEWHHLRTKHSDDATGILITLPNA